MSRTGLFDIIERRTLVALWSEANRIVHGEAVCLYADCPHSIDMADLLVAVSRISSNPHAESESPPAMAN